MAGRQVLSQESLQQMMDYVGPVPGQSLTNSTDVSYAWEQPPQFTNRREAEIYILEELTEKEAFRQITDMIIEGVPIESIARTYLLSGYSRGLWTVDMILLLAESVGFIIMALAEKAGLDYELYTGENQEADADKEAEVTNKAVDIMKNQIRKAASQDLKAPDFVSPELNEAVQDVDVKSLLERSE